VLCILDVAHGRLDLGVSEPVSDFVLVEDFYSSLVLMSHETAAKCREQ
jgi:hypothetical protein